jgi:glycosyltransferase involved in cell wall biosynthesis
LSPEKNPLILLDAYRRLQRPNTTLIIVGDGRLMDEATSFVAEHKLDSVIFYGFQNRHEIGKFYAACDALVVPSDREATGGVINEAMCFGLPVVVSDQVGFKQDFAMEGYTGFTFPVGDVEELTRQLERIIDLPTDERKIMSERSIKVMDDWLGRDLPGFLADYLDRLNS